MTQLNRRELLAATIGTAGLALARPVPAAARPTKNDISLAAWSLNLSFFRHHRWKSTDLPKICRQDLGIRATVIGLNRRGRRKWPKTKYRRQMVKRFRKKPRGSRHRRVYGQRWQAESAISRHKRRLGSALGARSDAARERECHLRILTHNLMLLAATQ